MKNKLINVTQILLLVHIDHVKVTGVHLERVVLYEWDWEKTVQCIYGGMHLSLKS